MNKPPPVRIAWDKEGIFLQKKLPIFYNALLLTGINLLLRFVSTSFQVFLSGRIGAAGIGLLQLVMSTGSMAMTAGMAGIRTATMYLTAEELGHKQPENITRVLSGCITYSILCSGMISILLVVAAPWIAENWIGDLRTIPSLRLYACFIPVTCLCGVMIGYFTAANRIGTLAAVEIAEQLFYILVSLLLLTFWAGTDATKACQSLILGSGFSSCLTLLCLMALRIIAKPPQGPGQPVRKRLLDTAIPLALADDLRTGISTTENLMVPKRLALFPGAVDPLATFGTVCGMVFPVIMFPASILFGLAELLIPELARCAAAASHKRIQYLVKRCLRVALLHGCLFSGLIFLLAEELTLWLYKSTDAAHYLKMYALLIPMLYCDAITDAMTKGLGQQKACVRYNIITSAMDVVFLFFLLPKYGMGGYFFSFLVTHLLNFILSLRRLLRIVGKVVSPVTAFFSAGSAAASILIAAILPNPILRCCVFLVAFGCMLTLLGVISKEDYTWLKGLISARQEHSPIPSPSQ